MSSNHIIVKANKTDIDSFLYSNENAMERIKEYINHKSPNYDNSYWISIENVVDVKKGFNDFIDLGCYCPCDYALKENSFTDINFYDYSNNEKDLKFQSYTYHILTKENYMSFLKTLIKQVADKFIDILATQDKEERDYEDDEYDEYEEYSTPTPKEYIKRLLKRVLTNADECINISQTEFGFNFLYVDSEEFPELDIFKFIAFGKTVNWETEYLVYYVEY